MEPRTDVATRAATKVVLLIIAVSLSGCDEWEQCITDPPEDPSPMEVCSAFTEPGYPKYVDASDEENPFNACYECETGECNPGVPSLLYYQLEYRTVRRVCNSIQEQYGWGDIICFAVRWNDTCCGELQSATCDFATQDTDHPSDGEEW